MFQHRQLQNMLQNQNRFAKISSESRDLFYTQCVCPIASAEVMINTSLPGFKKSWYFRYQLEQAPIDSRRMIRDTTSYLHNGGHQKLLILQIFRFVCSDSFVGAIDKLLKCTGFYLAFNHFGFFILLFASNTFSSPERVNHHLLVFGGYYLNKFVYVREKTSSYLSTAG